MPTAYIVALDDSDAEQGGGSAKGTGMIKQRTSAVKIATTTTAKQPTAKQPTSKKQHHHYTRNPPPTEYDEDDDMEISDPDDDQNPNPNPNHDEEDLYVEHLTEEHGDDGSGDGFGTEEKEEYEDVDNKKPAAKNTSWTSKKTKLSVNSSLVSAAERIIAAEEDYDDLLIDDLATQHKRGCYQTQAVQNGSPTAFGARYLRIYATGVTFSTPVTLPKHLPNAQER